MRSRPGRRPDAGDPQSRRGALPVLGGEAVIAGAPDPVIVADLQGTILLANAAAAALLGVPEHELVEQPLSRFVCPEESAALLSAMARVGPQATMRNVRGSVRSVTGERIPVSLAASAVRDGHGRVVGVLGFLRDLREVEADQAALERRAWTLERMVEERTQDLRLATQAKDEFLGVLSHELRTPLTPILTWAQIIKREPDPQRVQQAAEVIERNVRLQMALVEDLLDLTGITQGTLVLDRRRQDLRAIIQAGVDAVAEAAAEKRIRLEWLPPSGLVAVEADTTRLGQVFRQVLSNAVKFRREGGRVQVTLTREAETAAVRIRDDGAGIQPELLPLVFDMFRQQEEGSRRQYGGLGVGLALAKRLVELHAGTIALHSDGIGRGTEVTVRLPVWTTSGREPEDDDESGAARLDGVRILLVEDSPDTSDATRLLLEDLGAWVVLAKNGFDGLDVLATEEPDAILCDLRMPGLDGFEFLRRLRADPRRAHVRVIAVSGFARWTDYQRTREAGFDGHVSKPFDVGTLVAALRRVMRDPRRGQPAA